MNVDTTDDSFPDKDPLHFTIKKEIKDEVVEMECLFVRGVTSKDDLISEDDVDKSYSLPPEKNDPLQVENSNISLAAGDEKIATTVKLELFDVKQEVDLVEPIDLAGEDADSSLKTENCCKSKHSSIPNRGITHRNDECCGDSCKESISEFMEKKSGEIKESYVCLNTFLNKAEYNKNNCLRDGVLCHNSSDVFKKNIPNHFHKSTRKLKCIAQDESCGDNNFECNFIKSHDDNGIFSSDIINMDAVLKFEDCNSKKNNTTNNQFMICTDNNFGVGAKHNDYYCQNTFQSQNSSVNNSKKKFICNICQKSFSQSYNLKTHLSIHTGEKKFKCNFCEKSFIQNGNLKTHLSIHTSEKKFKCNFCEKSFIQKSNLMKHLTIHTGEKKFLCNICQKSFSQKTHLKIHLAIHIGEKKFTCNFCQKSFVHNSTLKSHISTHTGEKNFKCNICQMSFSLSSALKRHFAIHTGEKNFTCNLCHKSFSHSDSLKRHVSIHSGVKKFICKVCKISFRQNGHLTRHLSIHTSEKRFMCNFCKKCFADYSNLKRHCSIHTGEKKFICSFCQKCFRLNSSLKRHLSIHTRNN